MARRPKIVRTVPALRRALAPWREAGERIALVPTMGALHDGHLALVRLARKKAERVVVSVFVNPAQFAPHEDFATYPRTFDRDLGLLQDLNVDLVWAPGVTDMYPEGFSTAVAPKGPALVGLEDKFRPHFFGGVATVVSKLLIQTWPDFAIFGQKDYQQLQVITRMAADLDIAAKIVGAPTVREKDGLAMSSRNVYLSAEERATAPTLNRVLRDVASKINAGRPVGASVKQGLAIIERAGFKVDYLEARHAQTLEPIASKKAGPIRLLVAARLGKTRLIDNIGV
jgi:pantoate--beta-alanine ligase